MINHFDSKVQDKQTKLFSMLVIWIGVALAINELFIGLLAVFWHLWFLFTFAPTSYGMNEVYIDPLRLRRVAIQGMAVILLLSIGHIIFLLERSRFMIIAYTIVHVITLVYFLYISSLLGFNMGIITRRNKLGKKK